MDEEQKIRTSIDIFGTTYKMVGTYSQSYMKRLSAYINENMETIARSNPRLDSQKVGVLALISMADEFFQLRNQVDTAEQERTQAKRHIEELRKAFELTEEKEKGKSQEVMSLMQRIEELEYDNARLATEAELASASWSERVEEWAAKYAAAEAQAEADRKALQARIEALEAEREQSEWRRLQEETAAPSEAAPSEAAEAVTASADPASEDDLHAKYAKLQEEYVKLQNEFNEWIQLTLSETQ